MKPIPSLNSYVPLDHKGQVIWTEKGLSLNARLAVLECPQVIEMHGTDGWLAFYHAAKDTGWLPTAPAPL